MLKIKKEYQGKLSQKQSPSTDDFTEEETLKYQLVPSSLHGSRTLKMKESVSIFLIQQTETKKIRERARVENRPSLSAHGR